MRQTCVAMETLKPVEKKGKREVVVMRVGGIVEGDIGSMTSPW